MTALVTFVKNRTTLCCLLFSFSCLAHEPRSLVQQTAALLARNNSLLQNIEIPLVVQPAITQEILNTYIYPQVTPSYETHSLNPRCQYQHGVCSLEVMPNQELIISISCGGKISFCRVADLSECSAIENTLGLRSSCYLYNANQLITGTEGGAVLFWDCFTKKVANITEAHKGPINSFSRNSSEKIGVSASADKTIQLWDLDQKNILGKKVLFLSPVKSALFDTANNVVVGTFGGTISLHDYANLEKRSSCVNFPGEKIDALAVTSQNLVAAGLSSGTIVLVDMHNGKIIHTLIGHLDGVCALKTAHTSGLIVSGAWDTLVKMWDIRYTKELATYAGHEHWVQSVAVLDNGNKIVSGSRDHWIKLWDTQNICTLKSINLAQAVATKKIVAQHSDSGTKKEKLAKVLSALKKP